nr:hypothetical protein Q903MT_gene635 [Picea sitchensis]
MRPIPQEIKGRKLISCAGRPVIRFFLLTCPIFVGRLSEKRQTRAGLSLLLAYLPHDGQTRSMELGFGWIRVAWIQLLSLLIQIPNFRKAS